MQSSSLDNWSTIGAMNQQGRAWYHFINAVFPLWLFIWDFSLLIFLNSVFHLFDFLHLYAEGIPISEEGYEKMGVSHCSKILSLQLPCIETLMAGKTRSGVNPGAELVTKQVMKESSELLVEFTATHWNFHLPLPALMDSLQNSEMHHGNCHDINSYCIPPVVTIHVLSFLIGKNARYFI